MTNHTIWADGGESARAPEDTMQALWAALGAGADALVLPLQLTRDKHLVVCRSAKVKPKGKPAAPVPSLSAAELATVDAGRAFRSVRLDAHHQPTKSGAGKDRPWKGHGSGFDALRFPPFREVALHLSRRTSFVLRPLDHGKPAARRALVTALIEALDAWGLRRRATVAADGDLLAMIADAVPQVRLIRWIDARTHLAEVLASTPSNVSEVHVLAEALLTANGRHVAVDPACAAIIRDRRFAVHVGSHKMPAALRPDHYDVLAHLPFVAGVVARAVHETRQLRSPLHRVVETSFEGRVLDRTLFTAGYSRADNHDTTLRHADGFSIIMKAGGTYSGGAALTAFSIPGDFDARVAFRVDNPTQGTTFELAAIQTDPGYFNMDKKAISKRNSNLTFDVHGAPPYASSERDENDGFRIGWNNGGSVTEFVTPDGRTPPAPQSSNIYNKYGRDVGDGSSDNPDGDLRLVRRNGVFNAYYRDGHNAGWVLSGSVLVQALHRDVYLRLGAKHWPKRRITPPPNRIDFQRFELWQ